MTGQATQREIGLGVVEQLTLQIVPDGTIFMGKISVSILLCWGLFWNFDFLKKNISNIKL